jgi:hypothetical protein
MTAENLISGASAKPAFAPAGAAATAVTVFIHEFEIVLPKWRYPGMLYRGDQLLYRGDQH